jgi:hypothetical protein
MNRLDRLAKEYLTPVLKINGFKKKKLSWNRVRGLFVDIVDIQELPGSTEDNERFVLNVGVFVPDFYETVWGEPYKGFAKEVDAVYRVRLGDLLNEEFTKRVNGAWLNLDTDSDIIEVGKELVSAIEKRVLPCLDSLSDYESLHGLVDSLGGWQQDYPLMQIYSALLKRSLGDKDSAATILDGLISGKNKAWATHAQRIRAKK